MFVACQQRVLPLASTKCRPKDANYKTLVHAFINSRIDYCNSVVLSLAVQVSSIFILSNRFYTQKRDESFADGNAQYYTDNQRLYWLPIPRGLNISCVHLCTSVITEWRQHTSSVYAYLSQ